MSTKETYQLTAKGKALLSAIDSGQIGLESDGSVSEESFQKFNDLWEKSGRMALGESQNAGDVFENKTEQKNRNFTKYLRFFARSLFILLLGGLINHLLTG